jgi:transcriptional regulator with XRE-family HTH domain
MSDHEFPQGLRAAREARPLTQEALAEMLGVTREAVSQWERGGSLPGGPARRLLAQLFEVPLEVVEAWFAQPKVEAA